MQDERTHLTNLLTQYTTNIQHLELQAATYGGYRCAPLALKNQIDAQREEISEVQQRLRSWDTVSDARSVMPLALNTLATTDSSLMHQQLLNLLCTTLTSVASELGAEEDVIRALLQRLRQNLVASHQQPHASPATSSRHRSIASRSRRR